MYVMNPEQYSEQPVSLSKANPLDVRQPGEQVVCEIKRHPIGIIGNYIATILGLLAIAVVGYYLINQFVAVESRSRVIQYFSLGWAGLAIMALILLVVISKIYWNNRWIVTSDSLTQIQQRSLLQRQTSQLSMANLEDVTADRTGLLQSMFNFGTLHVETAGERSKFVFPFCPNPTECARQILASREAFIRNDPTMAKRANDLLNVPHYAATVPPVLPVAPEPSVNPEPPFPPVSVEPAAGIPPTDNLPPIVPQS